MRHRVIALTGGIGSGKSVVSSILRIMGYPVYDCDANARWLMDMSPVIKQSLIKEICDDAVLPDGTINRRVIADVVFNDPAKLSCLNRIVHGTVSEHLRECIAASTSTLFFFETAILQTAALDELADEVWYVTAPQNLRVQRVMARNGLTEKEVLARMANQTDSPADRAKIITNDGIKPLLPQLLALLEKSA